MRMIPCAQARTIHSESFAGSILAAFHQVLEARIVGMRADEDLWLQMLHQLSDPGEVLAFLTQARCARRAVHDHQMRFSILL